MEITKPNDIFVLSTLNSDLNSNDLLKSNILPDNTSFLDKDAYKSTEFVQKAFTGEDGKFDEIKFNDIYNKSAKLYEEISNDEFLKNNLEWDSYDLVRDPRSKTRSRNLEISKDINPYKNLYGRTSFDSIDKGDLSIRELAQKSKIFDTKSGKFLDKSANDLGLFGSLFNDTLVYAQWDEEGYHDDISTGRKVKHSKGEYKLDEDGNFYTETLGDREVYDKQIVNPTDLITTDGSAFNKIDYFDSDGKEKSVVGTTFKLATEIAPLFIPGVGTYYGAMRMAMGLGSALPTFYKSIEGIILGDSTQGNETDLWKAATKAEGVFARLNGRSYSDKGSESMFTYEQLGQMVADTFSQIYEQRAAANLSKLFYKVNKSKYADDLAAVAEKELGEGLLSGSISSVKNAQNIAEKAIEKIPELTKLGASQSRMAKSLSLGYMALTSTSDIYSEALAGGYDRRTAGVAALLAAGGQYSIMMNNRMGDWFLDKSVGYNIETNRAAIRKAIIPVLNDIETGVVAMDVNKEVGKNLLTKAITKTKNSIQDLLVNSSTTESLWKNAVVEGVEEVTEQAVMDATKGIVDTMSWLGMTNKRGSFNVAEDVFSKQGLQTYLSNLLGGFIGGGIFEINRLKIEPLINNQAIPADTEYSLLRLIGNGKIEEIKSEIDKRIKSLGNSSLSPVLSDSGNEKIYLADEQMSQAQLIAEGTKKYIDYLDSIMNSEDLKLSDEDIIRKTIVDEIKINDLESSNVHKFILSDFNGYTSDIARLQSKIKSLDETKDVEVLGKLNTELKQKRELVADILSGNKAGYYKQLSLFSLNRDLHNPFISLNVVDYAKQKYGLNYYTLPEDSGEQNRKKIDEEFNNIMGSATDKKEKMKFMYEVFDELNTKYSNLIGDYAEEKHLNSREKYTNLLRNLAQFDSQQLSEINSTLGKYGLSKYDLSDTLSIDLGNTLDALGYIDFSGLTQEEKQEQINLLNNINLPFKDLSSKYISDVVNSVKQVELEKIQEESEKELFAKKFPKIVKVSNDVIPLDLIYLSKELSGEKTISSEIRTALEQRLNTLKSDIIKPLEEVQKFALPSESIIEAYIPKESDGEEMYDNQYLEQLKPFIQEVSSNLMQLQNSIKNEDSLVEKVKYINEYNKYLNNLNNLYIQFGNTIGYNQDNLEFDAQIFKDTIQDQFKIPEVNIPKEVLNAEKLLTKPALENNLYKLLSNVNIDIYSQAGIQKTNILGILNDELDKFRSLENSEDYVRSKDVISNMKQAISTIQLVKSINVAMMDTSINPSNPYGFNVSMRNSLNKDSKKIPDQYRVISGPASVMLNKELSRIEDKLNYLINLSESNRSTIASEQKAIKQNMVGLLLNSLTSIDNKTSLVNLTIDGVKIIDSLKVSEIMSSDKSDEEKLIEVEDLAYNSFSKISGIDTKNYLDKLFAPFYTKDFMESVMNSSDEGLSKNLKSLSPDMYLVYLHSILSVSSKEFYSKYKTLLQKELSLSKDRKAPFYAQEYAIRVGYAYLKNKTTMSHVYDLLKKASSDKELDLKNEKSVLENLLVITGSGGVGKTTVISNFLLRMVQDQNPDVIISAPTKNVLDKLKSDIGRGDSINTLAYHRSDLIKKLIGEDNYKEYIEATNSLLNAVSKSEGLNNKSFPDKDPIIKIGSYLGDQLNISEEFLNKVSNFIEKDTIIIADEIGWFSPLDLQLINYLSSKGKIYFIGLGDDLQNGYSLGTNPYSLSSFYYLNTPKLKGVIRGKNIHKKDNSETLETTLNLRMQSINNNSPYTLKTKINYFEESKIFGDKFVDKLSVDDLLKLDKSKEIAIIVKDGILTPQDKATIESAGIKDYKIIAEDAIQGQEFDQLVSLISLSPINNDPINNFHVAKQLYTLLSRAKETSIIVGLNDTINKLGYENERKFTNSSVELIDTQIDTLLNDRFEFLNGLDLTHAEIPESKNDEQEDEAKEESDLYTEGLPDQDVDTTDKPEEKDKFADDKNFFVYSFYNVLHAKVDEGKLQIKGDYDIPSDMQTINLIESQTQKNKMLSMNPKELINDFVEVKNMLLHNQGFINTETSNYFSFLIDAHNKNLQKSKLVIRKLEFDKEYIDTYGKQAHINGIEPKKKSYLFLSYKGYLDVAGEKPFYVTLGALPDYENANWTQIENKKYLQELFENLGNNEEVEISTKPEIYSGLRFIYDDGTNKRPESNQISISGETPNDFIKNLKEKSPGIRISDVSKIKVFGADIDVIKKTLEKTGYDIPLNKERKFKNLKLLRFRPYIKVSYIDPNNEKFSKIIVLNPKKRSLLEAYKEFEELQNEFINLQDSSEKQTFAKDNFPVLIDKWTGLKLFIALTKDKAKDSSYVKDLTSRIKTVDLKYTKLTKEEYGKLNDQWDRIFEILLNTNGDISNLSEDDKKIVLGTIKGQTKTGNLGLRLLECLSLPEITSLGDYTVYYNTIFNPDRSEKGEQIMDGKFIKYFELNSYIEPPIFMLNLDKTNIVKPITQKVEELTIVSEQEEKPISDPLVISKVSHVSFNINGQTRDIPFNKWGLSELSDKEIDKFYKSVGTLNEALNSVVGKINSELKLNSELKNDLIEFNLLLVENVLNNANFIKDNGLFDTTIPTLAYQKPNFKNVTDPILLDKLKTIKNKLFPIGLNPVKFTICDNSNLKAVEITDNKKQLLKNMCK